MGGSAAEDPGAVRPLVGGSNFLAHARLSPNGDRLSWIAWNHPQGHAETVCNLLRGLPDVEASAGVPMVAPALIVPRVFSFELCDFLVAFYEQQGGVVLLP